MKNILLIILLAAFSQNVIAKERLPLCIEAIEDGNVRSMLEKKVTKNGVNLDKILASGIVNKDSKIGCYAGDAESYELFSPIFEHVLKEYHHTMKNTARDHYSMANIKEGFSKDAKRLIKSTRIRFARNIASLPFPSSMSKEDRINFEDNIQGIIAGSNLLKSGKYHKIADMKNDEKERLIQEHLLFKDLKGDRFLDASGISNDYPIGRGIYITKDKSLIIWVNEEDHLRMISLKENSHIHKVFANLIKLESELSKSIKFAYSEKFGYLASCPTNIGTGMRASVLIKLEKLGKNEELLKKLAKSMKLDVRGSSGEHSESSGYLFDISNSERFGKRPEELINNMIKGVNILVEIDAMQ